MSIDRRTVLAGAASFVAMGAVMGEAPELADAQVNAPAERVLGIGGFFFKSADPKASALWYQVHLGIDPIPTAEGQPVWQQTAGPTAFAPFPATTKYFGSQQQAWMINFRVRNLDAMVAQLQKAGIEVKVDPEKYPNGRFARLHDLDGNPIELWEPATHA